MGNGFDETTNNMYIKVAKLSLETKNLSTGKLQKIDYKIIKYEIAILS